MIIAANFLEAKKNRYLLPEYPAVYLETHITNLIGDFRDTGDTAQQGCGQALFADYEPGIALTHAHPVDQWQIYLTGKARLTRKPVAPVVIQYTDEWIPYGPIEVEPGGFALIALWPRPNLETYEMPKDIARIRENLREKPHRHLLHHIDLKDSPPAEFCESHLIEEGEIWARRWQLPPGVSFETPSAASGGGQFYISLSGTVVHAEEEYPLWSTIYIGREDHSIVLRSGSAGADVLGVQFRPQRYGD
jgi:hypothetical protein